MSATLKHCPYCGSTNLDDTCRDRDAHQVFYFVFCNKCEACGPTDYDRDKAIELWNGRRSEADDDY